VKFGSALMVLVFGVVLAQAGLVISPRGDQVVNPTTGITRLPQGGVVEDRERGIRIDAKFIEHKQGEFIRATDATILTAGQTIKSPLVNYQIKLDRVDIAGPLEFSSPDVTELRAQKAVAYPEAERIVAVGGVQSRSPVLTANAVVFDTRRRVVFLYGAYRFESRDGKTKLSQLGSESALLVTFPKSGNPTVTTKITPEDRALFVRLIEQSR
jgi:hypothetical protein